MKTEFTHSFSDEIGGPDCSSCQAARVLPVKTREKMRLRPERWEPDACIALSTTVGAYTVRTHFLHCERRIIGGANEWYESVIYAERKYPDRLGFREWLDFRRGYATKELAEFGHEQVVRMVESGAAER